MAYYIYSDRWHHDCIGMYDDDGCVYEGRQFFDGFVPDMSHFVGRFEGEYVYRDRWCRECAGMLERSTGQVYEGRSFFDGSTPGTSPIGYVSHDGEVYNEVSFFTDTKPSSYPVAYVQEGGDVRMAGAACLLLGLCEGGSGVSGGASYGGGASSGGSYGGGAGGAAAAGGGLGCLLVLVIALAVFLLPKLPDMWAEHKAEEAYEAQRSAEIREFYATVGWEEVGDNCLRYHGYFGEIATKDTQTPDFTTHTDRTVTVTVTGEDGLEFEAYTRGYDPGRLTDPHYANGESFLAWANEQNTIVVKRVSGTGHYTIDVVFE